MSNFPGFWCSASFGQVPRKTSNTVQFQHCCKLASYFLQSAPSENCLLIRMNTIVEITKTFEPKNVMPLIMENIWSSVNPLCKNLSQISKIMLTQTSPGTWSKITPPFCDISTSLYLMSHKMCWKYDYPEKKSAAGFVIFLLF